MIPAICFRTATLSDLDVITEFNMRMAEETESLQLDHERLLQGVEAVLRDSSKGMYYVAECDGKVVGQLLVTMEWSDWRNGMFWWIQSVYVLPEYRRKRIFSLLYRSVENLARSTPNVCGLRLYVDKSNESAIATYTALGMEQTRYELMEVDFVLQRKSN
jgi:ribosomal protein S18 acetylase RimI-like enzyme